MKPWLNPMFRVICYLCGNECWNLHARDAWAGAKFQCSYGCDPEDVRRYQLKLAAEKRPQEPEYSI